MSDLKNTVKDAAHKVADAASAAGHAVAGVAERAVNLAKEKTGMGGCGGADQGVAGIREHMDVIASCGKKVGVVDHLQGSDIKLTRKDSPDGQHHFIPTGWVARVDQHVHLSKNSAEAEAGWRSEPAAAKA